MSSISLEPNALSLKWSFGFNASHGNMVHNLSKNSTPKLFYVSSHTGVIHDTASDSQKLLQGHANPISAVTVSSDKRWIATADSGKDSMLIVWDVASGDAIKVLPLGDEGAAALDISQDSMFLVSLTAEYPQKLMVWEWTVASKEPAIVANIGNHQYQHAVRFNPVDVRDIVTTGSKKVVFWNWTQDSLAAFHPPKGIKKLKKNIGDLTETMFIPFTTKAVTATASGHAVLWDYPVSELVQSSGRDAIKILKVALKTGINLIDTILDRYIVCGCSDGSVRFFDFQFRVVAWFEDIQAGEVMSVSFAENSIPQSAASTTGNVTMDDFSVPDFVVSTKEGKIIVMDSRAMEEVEEARRRGQLLVQGFDGDVYGLAAHPFLPIFATGTKKGLVQLWDIDERRILARKEFANDRTEAKHKLKSINKVVTGPNPLANFVNVLEYRPDGELLAVGFANGLLKLLDTRETSKPSEVKNDKPQAQAAAQLEEIASFKNSRGAITHLSFSHDGEYLATADTERAVSIYRWYHRDEDVNKPVAWIFIGKYVSHYKPITSLYFEPPAIETEPEVTPRTEEDDEESKEAADENVDGEEETAAPEPPPKPAPRLFSLGEDRLLQEYDVAGSSIRTGVKVADTDRIDQVATPTCMVVMPPYGADKAGDSGLDAKKETAPKEESESSEVETFDEDPKSARKAETVRSTVIITANDEYKLKIWDMSGSDRAISSSAREHFDDPDFTPLSTKICRKTLLAPTYGGPVTKLFVLPRRKGKNIVPSPYLVYSTFERTVGLIQLPLDGNPNKAMATVAHPGEISCVTCSYDGQYLITAGGPDRSVKLWAVTPNALKASVELSGGGIEPYMGLIEGEKNGAFFQEVLDYFYFAQLRSQGLNTTQDRSITGHIPVAEVINLMRALGYYPSESDVHDIKTEIAYQHYNHAGKYKDAVDLEEFIRLFVNYRPVFSLNHDLFEKAFQQLGIDPNSAMGRDELIEKLQTMGERMSNKELYFAIDSLLGEDTEKDPMKFLEGLSAAENKTEEEEEEVVDQKYQGDGKILLKLPEEITAKQFAETVLGFEDYQA